MRAADFVEQAQVTNWPLRIALVAVMFAILALVVWGMWRGWRGRMHRQQDVPPPATVTVGPVDAECTGVFIGTSRAGDWLDRIVVHDLGFPSRGAMLVGANGITFRREGARSFHIPAADVHSVRLDRGVAGTVRERDGVLVVTWTLGPALIESGFRADDAAAQVAMLDRCMALGGRT